MAENEKIGGIEIELGLDTSRFDTAMEAAIAKAIVEGSDLGEAIDRATKQASKSILDLDGSIKELGGALDGAKSSTSSYADSLSYYGEQAKRLEQTIQTIPQALDKASESASHFGDQLLKMGAGLVTLSLLKTVAIDALEFEANLQKAKIALDLFSGGAEQTQVILENLKGLALSDALSFPSLVTAEQRLLEFGVEADKIPGALNAAADAAAATNRSFDTVANAMERMVESGSVMARTLVTLGINVHDLGQVLGVADDQVKTAFKDLDQTERVQALTEALAKLDGTAAKVAQTIGGQWQNLKTDFAFTINSMVSALDPLITKLELASRLFLAFVNSGGVQSTVAPDASVWEHLFGSSKPPSALVGSGEGPTVSGLPNGTVQTGADVGSGEVLSLQDIVARNAALRDSAATLKEVEGWVRSFNNSIVGLWGVLGTSYDDYISKLDTGGKTAKSTLDTITADIAKAKTLTESLSGQPLADVQALIDKLSKLQVTAKAFADTDAFSIAAVKIAQLVDQFPKQFDEISNADAVLGAFFSDMAAAAATVPDSLNKIDIVALARNVLESQKQLDASAQTLQKTFTKAWEAYETGARKAAGITSVVKEAAQNLEPDWTKLWATFDSGTQEAFQNAKDLNAAYKTLGIALGDVESKSLKAFETMAAGPDADKVSLGSLEAAWARVSGQVQKLALSDLPQALKIENEYIDALKAKGAAIGQILEAEAKELDLEIKRKSQTGADATEEIIALAEKKAAIQALIEASQSLGQVYVGLRKDFNDAFDSLTHGIANNLVEWNDWGQTLTNIGKTVAKNLLDTFLTGLFAPLKSELNATGGLFDTLGKKITGIVKAISGKSISIPGIGSSGSSGSGVSGSGETATEGGGLPGGSNGDFGGEVSSGGGSLSSALGGVTSSLGSIASIAGAVAAIGSGITQGIQGEHMNNLLDEIEKSTRFSKGLLENLNTVELQYLPELLHLADIWAAVNAVNDQVRYGIVNVNVAEWAGAVAPGTFAGPGDGSSLPPISPLGSPDFKQADAEFKAHNDELNVLNQTYRQGAPIFQTLTTSAANASSALSSVAISASGISLSAGGTAPISGPIVAPDLGFAGSPLQKLTAPDRSGVGGGPSPISQLPISNGNAIGQLGSPAAPDFSARARKLSPIWDEYFALVPGATAAYQSGGDFKMRFDAAWKSLVEHGWSGDQKLDSLYRQLIDLHINDNSWLYTVFGPGSGFHLGGLANTGWGSGMTGPADSGAGSLGDSSVGTAPIFGGNLPTFDPLDMSTPTIPSGPTFANGNSTGGNSYITVNSLNPSARSTVRALSTAIQETGRSTR